MLIRNEETWNKIKRQDEGYLYNDFGTQFPGDSPTWTTRDFNKLHRISCSQIRRMKYMTEGKLTKHFFKSRKEAIDWLEENRKKQGYTFCKFCNPDTPAK